MIKSLLYSVRFPTGRVLQGDYAFSEGLTAITGRNEAGKSFTLEAVRALLFGNDAFRGKASDYKKFKGELVFEVKGTEYKVTRNGSKADLFCGEKQQATGVKPVNDAIRRLFGYGLDVFDVANNCSQGDIERIGAMKPTERKALIDKTIGLTAIDDLVDFASEELGSERRAAEAIEANLVEPEVPARPEGYRPIAEGELGALREQVQELHQVQGWLSAGRAEPTAPGPAPCEMPAHLLEGLQKKREALLKKEQSLKVQIAGIPVTDWTQEKVDEQRSRHNHNTRVARRHELDRSNPPVEDDIDAIETAEKARQLLAEIDRLDQNGYVVCPACGSDFPQEHDAISHVKAELEALGAYDLNLKGDVARLRFQKERRWGVQAEIDSLPHDEIECEPLSAIEAAENALKNKELLSQLKAELNVMDVPKDQSEDLIARKTWEARDAQYCKDLENWKAYVSEREAKEKRATELSGVEEKYKELAELAREVEVFDRLKLQYNKNKAAYEKAKLQAETHRDHIDQLEKARKALRELKARIKSHLLPSLNKVSSNLLSVMTGEERNKIFIDECFEIEVDDQPLATLSGSGKACVNLAIRIGLGQVLTNKVFSVFMADEFDASMDENRSEYTAECLQNLTGSIGQIVLVSHKTIQCAKHHIEVSNGESGPTGTDQESDRE